jgi:hypothetical protein
MQYDTDRIIGVLTRALLICRGILHSSRTGDVSQEEIERIIESTGQDSLVELLGYDTYLRMIELYDAVSREDVDKLLGLGDESN